MSFEAIPPFTDDEISAIRAKIFLILGALLAVLMLFNIWSDRQLDKAVKDHSAYKEASHGKANDQ
jgi:hypothetical protein